MKKMILWIPLLCLGLLSFVLTPHASAGEWSLIAEDAEKTAWHYTGMVDHMDAEALKRLCESTEKQVVIHIDSNGGLAFEGIDLYWTAVEYGVHTYAGHEVGAWSAAALFWMGGLNNAILYQGSIVGHHYAYCNPWIPPGCGSGTHDIDAEYYRVLVHFMGRTDANDLMASMDRVLHKWGVSGFVVWKKVQGHYIIEETAIDPTTFQPDRRPELISPTTMTDSECNDPPSPSEHDPS